MRLSYSDFCLSAHFPYNVFLFAFSIDLYLFSSLYHSVFSRSACSAYMHRKLIINYIIITSLCGVSMYHISLLATTFFCLLFYMHRQSLHTKRKQITLSHEKKPVEKTPEWNVMAKIKRTTFTTLKPTRPNIWTHNFVLQSTQYQWIS